MRIKGIILSSIVLALLGIFFLSEVYLRGLVENKIAEEISTRFEGDVIVNKVEIESWPALKLLTGKADKVFVSLANASFGSLVISEIRLEIDKVQISFSKSGLKTSAILDNAEKIAGKVIIKENQLNDFFLRERFLPLKDPKLKIEDGYVKVMGKTRVLNSLVGLVITGKLEVTNQEVIFLPQEVEVAGFSLPEAIEKALLQKLGFSFKLESLPFELKFTEVQVNGRKIEVTVSKGI